MSFAPAERLREWVPFFIDRYLVPALGPEPPPALRLAHTRFLADPQRIAYRTYGLGRLPARRVYSLAIMLQYARWAVEGKPLRKPDDDTLQRGGDFVVGRDGVLTLAHVGSDQSERPEIRDVLAALDR